MTPPHTVFCQLHVSSFMKLYLKQEYQNSSISLTTITVNVFQLKNYLMLSVGSYTEIQLYTYHVPADGVDTQMFYFLGR